MANEGIVYKWSRTKANYIGTCTGNLGLLFLFVGMCAQMFYEDRAYVSIFGISCSLQIVNCVLLHMNCSKDSPLWLFIASILNIIWIAFAIILFLIYKLWVSDSEFDADMVFQFSLWFFVILAIIQAVYYFFLIKHLEAMPSLRKPQTKPKTGPTTGGPQSDAIRTK